MRLKNLLRTHRFFAGLSEEQYTALGACGDEVEFAPGEMLLSQGEVATQVFFVIEGQVLLSVNVPPRGRLAIETLGPGEPVGLSWLLPEAKWMFDARAQTPVKTVMFDSRCLQGILDADPTLGYPIMQRFLQATMHRLQASRVQLLDLYAVPGGTGA